MEPSVETILKKMEEITGEKPEAHILFSKIVPEWTPREVGEAILVARFALASTIFATTTPALRNLAGGDD